MLASIAPKIETIENINSTNLVFELIEKKLLNLLAIVLFRLPFIAEKIDSPLAKTIFSSWVHKKGSSYRLLPFLLDKALLLELIAHAAFYRATDQWASNACVGAIAKRQA